MSSWADAQCLGTTMHYSYCIYASR